MRVQTALRVVLPAARVVARADVHPAAPADVRQVVGVTDKPWFSHA